MSSAVVVISLKTLLLIFSSSNITFLFFSSDITLEYNEAPSQTADCIFATNDNLRMNIYSGEASLLKLYVSPLKSTLKGKYFLPFGANFSLFCFMFIRSLVTGNRKTYLYNFDPLKPHFYIVKLGFTGVYIIFLISAQLIECGYSARRF